MRCKSVSGCRRKLTRGRGKLPCRYGSRVLRFETLDARWMCAADSGSPAATYPIPDDNPALPAMVSEQTDVTDTPTSLTDVSADAAWQLFESASDLPSADIIDTLRILKDLEAIEDFEEGAAGLPGQDHEDVNPLTMADQLLGGGSSHPEMPGMPTDGDRMEMLNGMMETFRRRGSDDGHEDSPRDPFARVGWASDNDHSKTTSTGAYSTEFQHQPGRTVVYFNTTLHRPDPESGATVIVEEHIYTPTEGGVIVHQTITGWDSDNNVVFGGTSSWAKPYELEDEEWEAARNEKLRGDGSQPNPADDSDGFGFLDSDPWATFLAWYTGQQAPQPNDPRDDDPGGTVEETGHGQESAAPRVGPDAVTNPVDPLWGSSGGGGGGDGPNLPGCVFPVGPPRM